MQFSYSQCENCGQIYLCPRPDSESLSWCYSQLVQSQPSIAEDCEARPSSYGWLRRTWHKLIGDDLPALPWVGPHPVLDVGSNDGEFLLALRDRGVACEGLEFNAQAVKRCLRLGLTVHLGDVESAELPAEHYGTITLVHTLEHLSSPVDTFRKLGRALRPDGRIVIIVPNVQSPMRRIFGNNWQGWDPPFHLAHYDAMSLGKLAKRAELQLTSSHVLGSVEDLRRSLNLYLGQQKRRLLLRVLALPLVKALEFFGRGGVLVGVLEHSRPSVVG